MSTKESVSAQVAGLEKDTKWCMATYLLDLLYDKRNNASDVMLGHYTIVRMPDYNGGHYFELCVGDPLKSEDLGNFEYVEWEGSCYEFMKLMADNHKFMAHVEPFHEPAEDYPVSAQQLFADYLARLIDRLS